MSFGPLAALAGFGLWRLRADPTARLLGLALLLWLGVWGLTANLLTYHVAGAALLAAVLAAPALAELLTGRASAWRDLCVATLLVLCMGSWIFRTGVLGETPGVTLAVRDVAWLQRAVARRGGSCLCVAPYHPIFVRDAPRVFRYHELFSPRWAEAVDWALERRPGAIVSLHDPRVLVALGSLDEPRRQALAALLRRGYRAQHLAEARVWLAPLPRAPARARAGAAPM